jgi:hypothetical protein
VYGTSNKNIQNSSQFLKNFYIIIVCSSQANRTLGCMKRYAKYFYKLSTLTTLFMSLVRSTLEYDKTHVGRLEKVQYRFFKFIR